MNIVNPLRFIDRGGFLCIFRFSLFTFHDSLGFFIMGEFSVIILIPFSKGLFLLGVGRGCEGRTQRGKGETRKLAFPLSPLGSPLALPFPHSLFPLGRESLVWRSVLDVSRSDELRHNTRLTPLGERGSGKGERERETLRREGNASLRVSPLSLGCLSRIRAPRPIKFNTRTKG